MEKIDLKMKAIILAAGKSTRTYPLTLNIPKPLLKIANKPILERNLDSLAGFIDEAVIVVGYKKEIIQEHFGDNYNGIKIKYVEQKEQLGTGHALFQASFVKGRFFVMMGDDLYSRYDIERLAKYDYAVLGIKVSEPSSFGVFVLDKGLVKDVFEKPKKFVGDIANCALYVFDGGIFRVLSGLKKTERGEYELTDGLKELAQIKDVNCVIAKNWFPIAYPWDVLKADLTLRKKKNSIGKNTLIEGKVENCSIGDNCIIKGKVKNSIVYDNSIIEKNSSVKDSVIGCNVRFKGAIKSSKNIVGDNSILENVEISSGVVIWQDKKISGKAIKEDVI